MILELAWDLRGSLPADPGYQLYAAVCGELPAQVHGSDRWAMAVVGEDLRIRCDLELAGAFIEGLRCARLRVGEQMVHLPRAAQAETLQAAPELVAEGVTIKDSIRGTSDMSTDDFGRALARQLADAGVQAGWRIGGQRLGMVRGRLVAGYAVHLRGLDPAGSLRLQARGLGGRLRMGWGWLRPPSDR